MRYDALVYFNIPSHNLDLFLNKLNEVANEFQSEIKQGDSFSFDTNCEEEAIEDAGTDYPAYYDGFGSIQVKKVSEGVDNLHIYLTAY